MIRKKILVIGYGEMGHAMSHLLQPNHDVTIWQRHPESGSPPPLTEAALDKDFVFFCVPTEPVNSLAQQIKPSLSEDTICLSVGKGLDNEGRPAFKAMTDALGSTSPHAVIYGPMIAEELISDRPGFAQVGSVNDNWARQVQQLFDGTQLYLSTSNDTTGLSWCAVLKNVYAIAFGMADGLNLGDNVRGFLAATALNELADIAVDQGGKADAPYGLAGLGDLMTTATSTKSNHHSIGVRLALGSRDNIKGEGIHTLAMVKNSGVVDISRYPLFSLVAQIVEHDVEITTVWQNYLASAFPSHQN